MQVHPLITIDPQQLDLLLVAERRDWLEALSWDPSDAQKLLLNYVGQRLLPGCVAFDAGRPVGYTYYLTRETTGMLGTLYMTPSYRGTEAVKLLLETTLDGLRRFSPVDRIEAQIFPLGMDLRGVFSQFNFHAYRRQYLCKKLADETEGGMGGQSPREGAFHFLPWTLQRMESSAVIIQAGYANTIDQEICSEYAGYESCLMFLRNLTGNPGCGAFLPQASFLATDVRELPSGVVLTSALSPSTALIAQISVLPGYQGCGLGGRLMMQALTRLASLGFAQVCLSVTEQNQKAYDWYRRLGFEPRQELWAFVWRRETV